MEDMNTERIYFRWKKGRQEFCQWHIAYFKNSEEKQGVQVPK